MSDDPLSELCIMIVDDQRAMRMIIRSLLSQVEINNVIEAEDGQQALDYLQHPANQPPDLVICDLHMANVDGLEFSNLVRRNKVPKLAGIPILILTGDSDKSVLVRKDLLEHFVGANVQHSYVRGCVLTLRTVKFFFHSLCKRFRRWAIFWILLTVANAHRFKIRIARSILRCSTGRSNFEVIFDCFEAAFAMPHSWTTLTNVFEISSRLLWHTTPSQHLAWTDDTECRLTRGK